MKLKHLSLLLTSVCAFSLSQVAVADILMKWERKPLPMALEVKTERIIFFDKAIEVKIPAEIDESKLSVQSIDGAVYLKALATFPTSRFEFKDLNTGEIFLFDIGAHNKVNNPSESVRLVAPASTTAAQPAVQQDAQVTDAEQENINVSQLPAPLALVRYAAQSLYAPLRTVEPLEGVRKIAHRLPSKITTLLPHLPIQATPLISWQLDKFVVTAIRLQNKGTSRISLDQRELQGRFHSASFQHEWLGGNGSTEDTTTLYIVTEGYANHAVIPESKKYKAPKKVKKTTVTKKRQSLLNPRLPTIAIVKPNKEEFL